MADPATPDSTHGPLSLADLAQLEATLLPALERHHLRLLAHALRTLQQVQRHAGANAGQGQAAIPQQAAIEQWLRAQPELSQEPMFSRDLAQQLTSAGRQLEAVARPLGRPPLDLDLETLITWARHQADARLPAVPASSAPVPAIITPTQPLSAAMQIDNAISFFRLSCGRWHSQRSSHHLLHRRAEAGGSLIVVDELDAADPRLAAIAALHQQDPQRLVGGCRVRWSGSMAWDKAGETHEGESLFGLIPTDERGRSGLLLRDRGYAETAPVAGEFHMDERDALLLTTGYETMNSLERFSFAGPDVRLRTSTVEGLSNTASFCVETRLGDQIPDRAGDGSGATAQQQGALSPLGW